ncbi:hypothetical protein ABIC83_002763 [Roseateles asaccharophilus]|uniref:hypothetical protein n=1 Tax=Roseateles asaccharophilus TaxID=582607 RepID=UPI003838E363
MSIRSPDEDELDVAHRQRMRLLGYSHHLSLAAVVCGGLLAAVLSNPFDQIAAFAGGCLIGLPAVSYRIVRLGAKLLLPRNTSN